MAMMTIKSTWKPVTQQDVLDIFNEIIESARKQNLFAHYCKDFLCVGLYQSSRKSRNIGVCRTSYQWQEWCIILNDKLLNCSIDQIRKVLVHEIAHACVPKAHHGWEWKYVANILGAPYGYEAERLSSDEEVNHMCDPEPKERKYIVECPVCGVQWRYKVKCRIVKYPMLYHHTKCGTDLVRVDNLD